MLGVMGRRSGVSFGNGVVPGCGVRYLVEPNGEQEEPGQYRYGEDALHKPYIPVEETFGLAGEQVEHH